MTTQLRQPREARPAQTLEDAQMSYDLPSLGPRRPCRRLGAAPGGREWDASAPPQSAGNGRGGLRNCDTIVWPRR
jgi:hypothetical protein